MSLPSKRGFAAVLATAVASLISLSPSAHAYDEDTHFYGTYAMARYAGIRHEVAAQIALSAQWMDESYISDPTSMIFLPITGIKKRRLLHFPSSRIVGQVAADTSVKMAGLTELTDLQKKMADEIAAKFDVDNRLLELQFMTQTTEDHPLASELLMEGLKRGNLMMASAAIHTIEDSYAHAGTPAEMGHAAFWHWPDRPFSSPQKYLRMEHGVFSALVAIRTMLPREALDCKLNLAPVPTSTPNCEMDAALLADNYAVTAAVNTAVGRDILKEPEYVATAIRDLLFRGVKAKYVRLSARQINQIVDSLPKTNQNDAYDTTRLLMKKLLTNELEHRSGVVNIKFILSDMGRLKADASDAEVAAYARSFGVDNLLARMADELLLWKVPAPLSDTHRMELEDDKGPLREKEMELRIGYMQDMIRQLFNKSIVMIPNSTKDETGFARELLMDPKVESVLKKDPTTAYVTFSLKDRSNWDKMIFSYLFPSLKEEDLGLITSNAAKLALLAGRLGEYNAKRKLIEDNKSMSYVNKKMKLLRLDRQYKVVSSTPRLLLSGWEALSEIKPFLPTFVSDMVTTHISPSPDNFYYRDPMLFGRYIRAGIVRPFLGSGDVWSLGYLMDLARVQAGAPRGQRAP